LIALSLPTLLSKHIKLNKNNIALPSSLEACPIRQLARRKHSSTNTILEYKIKSLLHPLEVNPEVWLYRLSNYQLVGRGGFIDI